MIAQETIAAVRDRTDIVALITESVPSLKRRGRTFVGLCPFHKEKTPSFHVNPDKGFFHCFGCKEHGSGIDFLMKLDGLTFPEAVRALAERAGIVLEEEKRDRTDLDRQKKAKDDLYAVSNLAAVYYEEQLCKHAHKQYALDELARRGLTPTGDPGNRVDETLQAFRIGYAPPGWDGLASFLRAQGVSPMAAEQVGLLVPRSSGTGHYDRFRHRLMFAVTDTHGRVVAFSGRALEPLPGEDAKQGDKAAKYINSPESPIYTKGHMLFGLHQARHEIREEGVAIVVEGNFDVVSLHARGLANVVAPLGTAFTIDQAKLLKRFATSVVLCFDGDAAGRKATKLSRGPLKEAGLPAKVANLPEGTDPDELQRGKGIDALKGVVRRARGMLEFLIEEALDASFAAADAHERAARVTEVARLLAEEDDALVRSMAKSYADQLAGRIDLKSNDAVARRMSESAFAALERQVKSALQHAGPPPRLRPGETNELPRNARVAYRPGAPQRKVIVGALVEYPQLLADPEIESVLSMLEGPSARTVSALAEHYDGKRLDTSVFLAQIPDAIQAFAAERLAAPLHATVEDARADLLDAARSLRTLLVTQETEGVAREQQKTEEVDFEAALALADAARKRTREKQGLPATEIPREAPTKEAGFSDELE